MTTLFNGFSLRKKIYILTLLNVALLLFFATIGLQLSSAAQNRQLYRAISGNLSFSSHTIADKLKSVETLSASLIASNDIQNALDTIDNNDSLILRSNSNRVINRTLSSYMQTARPDGVKGISLYNHFFVNATNSALITKAGPLLVTKARRDAQEKAGAVAWNIDYDQSLAILSRSVRKIDNLSLAHLGDCLIFVSLDDIVRHANNAVTTYDDVAYMLYDHERLLYASNGITPEEAADFLDKTGTSYSILQADGHSYFAVKNTLPYYGWTYINLISYDQIADSISAAYRLITCILVIGLVVAIALTRLASNYILKDFDLLIHKMEVFRPEGALPQVEVNYSNRHDEISRLHQQFDAMAAQIQALVQTNYLNQILSQEAKLKALEAQINPHFLYNTLETINWRAKALQDAQTSAMVEALGSLLRETLSNKKKLTPLSRELALVESYMTIQRIRFDDRLNFSMSCEPAASNALVPPFTIQPLLENAIRYGMEEMVDLCTICVHAFIQSGRLIIEVSNDGSQFDEDILEKLANGQSAAHGFGIGLSNIDQRIRILFGEHYGLSFRNECDTAIAVVTLPLRFEDNTNI